MITFQRMKLSADLRQIRYEFKKNWMCNVIVIAFTGNNTATNKNEKRKIIPQQGYNLWYTFQLTLIFLSFPM